MKFSLLITTIFLLTLSSITSLCVYAQEETSSINEKYDEDGSHPNNDIENNHNHSEEDQSNGEGEDEEESKAEIEPESAQHMGIIIAKVSSATFNQTIPMNGRIVLNENTRAVVRARFTGIVRSVSVDLGERVKKGQILAIIESNESLRNYNITAPIHGVILERNTNVGDVVGSDAIFVIADLSNVWARFYIFSRDANYIKKGQSVSVKSLEGDKVTSGKIDMFFPTADELTQTQIAIVDIDNPNRIWKPGMTIEGDVNIAEVIVQIAVKTSALQKMEELGDVVFVKEGNSYIPRAITVGRKGNGYVEIIKGLQAGESYVAEGSFIVKSDILKATAAHSH